MDGRLHRIGVRQRDGALAPHSPAPARRIARESARAQQCVREARPHDGLLHPEDGLGTIALGSIPVLPGALRLAEHELALMEAGGVPADRAALAVDLIAQFAASTAVERTVRLSRGDVGDDREHVLTAYERADAERFPHVARSASLLTGPDDSARRDFAIDVLLTGIERAGVRRA
ncbi:TetR/AcrR family transcriptional regulator C-terminal domain-containing protein [Microbacterium sp. B19]|uniref:TetR/AcrR family transcriptional regulator C-terminal domain-containing protein n=1 Tax=Microbacterium sp. B19 TaxID=96765 RepID=UPI001EF9D5CA|nr:TetR/AcrR family transcriptional regulator C-terminal domain-containing protein [Microbacterium sp. B19]